MQGVQKQRNETLDLIYMRANKNGEQPIPTASVGSATSPYKVNSTRAHAAPRAPQSKRPSPTLVPWFDGWR